MDPGGLGAIIGVSIMAVIGIAVYIYDKCVYKSPDEVRTPTIPLIKKRSFKVKNLFNHVQI